MLVKKFTLPEGYEDVAWTIGTNCYRSLTLDEYFKIWQGSNFILRKIIRNVLDEPGS